MVWEHPYYPQYYLPISALKINTLPAWALKANKNSPTTLRLDQGKAIETPGGEDGSSSATATIAHYYTLTVGDRSVSDECMIFGPDLDGPAAPLSGMVKINFGAVDRWFEEDAPICMHPKDPFKRIDILPSTRRVQVFDRKGGKQLADAASSMHLYETGLPVRYYLPLTSVDASLLKPSSTKTQCPYKGEAEYYSVELPGGGALKDVVWYYERPIMESAKIEGELSSSRPASKMQVITEVSHRSPLLLQRESRDQSRWSMAAEIVDTLSSVVDSLSGRLQATSAIS